AHDGLPRYRAADGITDRRSKHRGGTRLAGGGFHMHAETGHQLPGLHHHVEQVTDGGTLISADVRHTGLQQGLGNREDGLAAEHLAFAERQLTDFSSEGHFHGTTLRRRRSLATPSAYVRASVLTWAVRTFRRPDV